MLAKEEKQLERAKRSTTILPRYKIEQFLAIVPYNSAFHFYEEAEKPTGQVARSLPELGEIISIVNSGPAWSSLSYHQRRDDFSNWTRDVVGDQELARRIHNISASDPDLKRKLAITLDVRVKQLRASLYE